MNKSVFFNVNPISENYALFYIKSFVVNSPFCLLQSTKNQTSMLEQKSS